MSKLFLVCAISVLVFLCSKDVTSQNFCNPSPCAQNADCEIDNGRPLCTCKPTYIGDPLTSCKRECEKDNDCPSDKGCMNYRCKDPCRNGCGDYANCRVENHQAICTCPEQYGGDAYSNCIPECKSQAECPSHLACIDLHCGDPCRERRPCKANSDCKVERHTAVCTCKRGYVGHPLTTGCFRSN